MIVFQERKKSKMLDISVNLVEMKYYNVTQNTSAFKGIFEKIQGRKLYITM